MLRKNIRSYFTHILFVLLSCFALNSMALADDAPAQKAQILILGTFSYQYSGRDLFAVNPGDVLSQQHQQEIQQLVTALIKFHPNKVFVADHYNRRVMLNKSYTNYLNANKKLDKTVVEQIAFRVAKAMQLKKIDPVGVPMQLSSARLIAYAKAHKQLNHIKPCLEDAREYALHDKELIKNSYKSLYLYLNTERAIEERGNFKYRCYAAIGKPGAFRGADYLSTWYKKNKRIFSNILWQTQSPKDRVLVIVPYDQVYWLKQSIDNSTKLEYVSPLKYLH